MVFLHTTNGWTIDTFNTSPVQLMVGPKPGMDTPYGSGKCVCARLYICLRHSCKGFGSAVGVLWHAQHSVLQTSLQLFKCHSKLLQGCLTVVSQLQPTLLQVSGSSKQSPIPLNRLFWSRSGRQWWLVLFLSSRSGTSCTAIGDSICCGLCRSLLHYLAPFVWHSLSG